MGKGKRVKAERAAGTRIANGTRWESIAPGMKMVIPKWEQVRMGAAPFVVPNKTTHATRVDKFTGEPKTFYPRTPGSEFNHIRQAMAESGHKGMVKRAEQFSKFTGQ